MAPQPRSRTLLHTILQVVPHLLWLALVALLWHQAPYGPRPMVLLALVAAIELARIAHAVARPHALLRTTWNDVAILLYASLLAWHWVTGYTQRLDAMFFPPAEEIARMFFQELPAMVRGAGGSIAKLLTGFVLALILGIGSGVLLSLNERLSNATIPFAKALGPIPPVIYIPYAICFLPNLVSAQVFVIFIGSYWPVFLSTLSGLQSVSRTQLDAARTLELKGPELVRRVLLPGASPMICTGALQGLIFAFILLTAAELLGSASGIGWYVKNSADFGDFQRVLVGVAFVTILVFAATTATGRIEKRLLKWCE